MQIPSYQRIMGSIMLRADENCSASIRRRKAVLAPATRRLRPPPCPTIASQYRSVSTWSCVSNMNETASFGANAEPPFSPTNRAPAR